jgi:predicted dinucleotide-binding enzyme
VDVTIIGTGNMARGIGSRVLAGGNALTVLGKTKEAAQAVADDLEGEAGGATIETGVSGTDTIGGDLVVLTVYYPDARAFVEQRGDALDGKPVVDVSVPVNETFDALIVPPDGSATQELSRLAEGPRFVKAFTTNFARTLGTGAVAGQPLDVLMAGDDPGAKALVAEMVEGGGLRPIDAGSLVRARELEAAALLHITLQNTLGSGFGSAIKLLY